MKRITIICGALAIAGTIAVLWQQQSLSKLRENPNRGFTNEVLSDSSATNAAHEQEIISLREQTKDLARLRNEVSRLRATRAELAVARAESTRMLEAKQNGTPIPQPPPGFTSRQHLANAGFGTPEAALQTFFWAMNQGEFEAAMQALSPANRERKHFDKLSPEERAHIVNESKRNGPEKSMAHFNDFGVRLREDVSEDDVVLHVGSSLSTNTMRMSLQRLDGEWKLKDFPQ